MQQMKFSPWWIILGVAVLALGWVAAGYNGLITSRENVRTQWSNVETNYQRRFDLVPNLVSSVKGASEFERQTFREITEARTGWTSAGEDRAQQIQAAQRLDTAFAGLRINVENYPTLRATDAYRDLMAELAGTENRINVARRDYNEAVREYNVRVQRFPGNIVAGIFGFAPEAQFEADAGTEKAPTVEF